MQILSSQNISNTYWEKVSLTTQATFNIPSIFNLKEETEKIGNTEYHFKVQVAIYPFGVFHAHDSGIQ